MSANDLVLTSNITSIPQCMETLFTWKGGTPGYSIFFATPDSVEVNKFQIIDQSQAAPKTRLPFPAGSQVNCQIEDFPGPQPLNFNFVVTDSGNTDCLPSNIPVSNPGNVQTYAGPTPDLPSFQVKGLTVGLQVGSCAGIEVDVTSGPPPYSVQLLPVVSHPNLPGITYGTNSNVTFPVPYPPGIAFTITVAGSRFAPNKNFRSDPIMILSGSTSCLLSGPDDIGPGSASSGPAPSVSSVSAIPSLSGSGPSTGVGSTLVSASNSVSVSTSVASSSDGFTTNSTTSINSPTSITPAPTNTESPSTANTFSRRNIIDVIVGPIALVTLWWFLM